MPRRLRARRRGPSFDLETYQQAMRKRYSRLKLEELGPTTHDIRPLMLTGMFIAQSARECAEFMPRVFELPKEFCSGGCGRRANWKVRRSTKRHSRSIAVPILNNPHASLLQYLLLQWAEKATPNSQQGPLPLLIELREYGRLRSEGKIANFLEYLHSGASVRWHFEESQLDAWLKANRSLVLFDGLDEVFDPTLRREISTTIHRFTDGYPRARIIVTSRIIGYQHQAWRDENFHHFMLEELDDDQIAEFFSRWHRAACDP